MIKITDKKVFQCDVCKKEFTSQKDAQKHNKMHDIIYVPFERQDLKRLVNFIQTGAVELLSQELVSMIVRYSSLRTEPRDQQNYEN